MFQCAFLFLFGIFPSLFVFYVYIDLWIKAEKCKYRAYIPKSSVISLHIFYIIIEVDSNA